MTKPLSERWLMAGLALLLAAGGYYAWHKFANRAPAGIASGNGRIEATEIDIAAKSPGRIKEILADEGDFVTAGHVLARMDTTQLEAQRRQAEAQLRRAIIGVDTAQSRVTQREAERRANDATVAQRQAQLEDAEKKLARSQQLIKTNTVAQQVLDDDTANALSARAALAAAQAQLAAPPRPPSARRKQRW